MTQPAHALAVLGSSLDLVTWTTEHLALGKLGGAPLGGP
jgi:hypothetical protein